MRMQCRDRNPNISHNLSPRHARAHPYAHARPRTQAIAGLVRWSKSKPPQAQAVGVDDDDVELLDLDYDPDIMEVAPDPAPSPTRK